MAKSDAAAGGGTLRDLLRVPGVREDVARALEPAAAGGEKTPVKSASVGPANAGSLPAPFLAEPGTGGDDGPPVRYVTWEAAAVDGSLAEAGLLQRGDERFNAAARLTPPASNCCSCRAAHSSWGVTMRMLGIPPGGGGGGGAAAMEIPRRRCEWSWAVRGVRG